MFKVKPKLQNFIYRPERKPITVQKLKDIIKTEYDSYDKLTNPTKHGTTLGKATAQIRKFRVESGRVIEGTFFNVDTGKVAEAREAEVQAYLNQLNAITHVNDFYKLIMGEKIGNSTERLLNGSLFKALNRLQPADTLYRIHKHVLEFLIAKVNFSEEHYKVLFAAVRLPDFRFSLIVRASENGYVFGMEAYVKITIDYLRDPLAPPTLQLSSRNAQLYLCEFMMKTLENLGKNGTDLSSDSEAFPKLQAYLNRVQTFRALLKPERFIIRIPAARVREMASPNYLINTEPPLVASDLDNLYQRLCKLRQYYKPDMRKNAQQKDEGDDSEGYQKADMPNGYGGEEPETEGETVDQPEVVGRFGI